MEVIGLSFKNGEKRMDEVIPPTHFPLPPLSDTNGM